MSGDGEEKADSFSSFGLNQALVEAIHTLGWTTPTEIQRQALPEALQGKDIIGLAETG